VRMPGLMNRHLGREYAMKSVAQAISGQAVTATADANRIRLDGAVRGASEMPEAVADQGKIRLGGGYRLPPSRTST
jgi:hypothetical protein